MNQYILRGLLLVLVNLSIIHAAIKYDDPGTFSTVPIFSGCLPTDDFASDPYDNVKFYRCANGYQYSMRCAPGTIYYGNALCDYDRSQPEPAPNPDWSTSFNYSDATVHFIPPVVIENLNKNITYWNINNNNDNNNNDNNNNNNNNNNIDSVSSTTRMTSTSTLLSSDLTTQKNLNSNLDNSSVSRISTSFMSSIRYTPSYIPTVSRSSVYYVTTKSNKISQSPVSLTSPFKLSSSSSASSSSLLTSISSSTVSSTVSSENTSSPQSLARSSTSASSQLLQETKTPECKSEAEVLVKTNKPPVVPCQCSCVGATYPLTMVINNV